MAQWYEVVVFTAGLREYADPIVDHLDAGCNIIRRRFFRDVREVE